MSINNPFAKSAVNIFTSNHTTTPVTLTPISVGSSTPNVFKPTPLGTTTVTSTVSNVHPIGSYRAQKYVSDKIPINPAKVAWSSMSLPISISAERQLENLSATELRLEDYYSIRTGNMEAKHKNRIESNIRLGLFKRNIYETKPTAEPITIKGIPHAVNTQPITTAVFPGTNTGVYNPSTSTTPNIFSKTVTTPPSTNPQNIFNNLANSGVYNTQTTQPTLTLNNTLNTSNIFKPQPQTVTTTTANIFGTANTSMTTSTSNNIFKPQTTTVAPNAGNIFANQTPITTSSTNIFNNLNNTTTAGNNIFNTQKPTTTGNILNNNNSSSTLNNIFNNNNAGNNQSVNLFNNNSNMNNLNNMASIMSNMTPNTLFNGSNTMGGQSIVIPIPDSLYKTMIQDASRYSESLFTTSSQPTKFKNYLSEDDYKKPRKYQQQIDFEPKFRYGAFQQEYEEGPKIKTIINRADRPKERSIFDNQRNEDFDINDARKFRLEKDREPVYRESVKSYLDTREEKKQSGSSSIRVYQTIQIDGKHLKTREVFFNTTKQDHKNSNNSLKSRIQKEVVDSGEVKSHPEVIITDTQYENGQFVAICLVKGKTINLPKGYWHKPQMIHDLKRTPLTIGNEHGEVVWSNPIDVRKIDFYNSVRITKNSLQLYEEVASPPVGTQLNQQCQVTFYSCEALERFRKKYNEPTEQEITKMLVNGCRKCGLEFISFNPKNEHWTMNVTPRY